MSLLRARSFFSLAAAGVGFLLLIPTLTHRQELARHELFQVTDGSGNIVGVKDCCPVCRSNRFVNSTDGGYNIEPKGDPSRCGVRFISTSQGCLDSPLNHPPLSIAPHPSIPFAPHRSVTPPLDRPTPGGGVPPP